MKLFFKFSAILLLFGLLTACNSGSDVAPAEDLSHLTLQDRIDHHIQNDNYEEALAELRNLNQEDATVQQLLIATHMTYALYLTYGSLTDMRNRMPLALQHYRRVLELDPGNERARAEIDQIEGIYRGMNREIPQGVAR